MRKLNYAMLSYLYLPLLIFLVGWCKWYVAIPITLLSIVGLFSFLKTKKVDEYKSTSINWLEIVLVYLFFVIFFIICGHGDLFQQDFDWNKHHAIYYDLMNYSWPVVYRDGSMLTYYLGQYIVPSFIAKILFKSIIVLRISIVLWNALGLLLVYLFLVNQFELSKTRNKIFLLIVMTCFGGPLIIGRFLYSLPGISIFPMSFKWLDYPNVMVHFAANFDALRGAFQHVIITWISCCLFFKYRDDFEYYLLFLIPVVFAATFGAVYLTGIMAIYFVVKCIIYKTFKKFLIKLFNFSNLSLVPLAIVIFIYLLGNFIGDKPDGTGFWIINMLEHKKFYILFCFSEFLCYYFVLSKKHKKDPVYWIILFELLAMPFLSIGVYNDFCSRGSIPARFILMIFCLDVLYANDVKRILKLIVVGILSFSIILTCSQLTCCKLLALYDDISTSDDYKTLEGFAGNKDQRVDNAYNYFTLNPQEAPFRFVSK